MNKLQELYAERDTFLKYGHEIPTQLAENIKSLEADMRT